MSADGRTGGGSILVVQDLAKSFGGLVAVNGASLDVEAGSITALIGPNGAGKTTLFNVITGFLRPDRGRIEFQGRRIERRHPYTLARAGLVRTFQATKALTRMSVLDNMMVAAPDQPAERLRRAWLPFRAREASIRARAMELLSVFDLSHLAGEYAGALSGGQRKLLELARALMTRPTAVLLDEPMAGVNPILGRRLLDHIRRLRDEEHMTFFFIEHDMEVVMTYGERIIVMAEGRVIADGTAAAIRRNQTVIDAYLGTAATGAP